MRTFLTFLSAPPSLLPITFLDEASGYLDNIGITILSGPTWVRPQSVARYIIDRPLQPDHISTLRLMAEHHRLDVLATPQPQTVPKLFLADMDSTMICGETLDDLAGFAGVREQVAALTARAMDGSMDYREALSARLQLVKGVGSDVINRVRTTQTPSPGAAELIVSLKSYGILTVLVSGGFTVFTEPIAQALGFDHHHGNTLDLDKTGHVTSRVIDPLIHHTKKREILLEYCKKLGITPAQAIATGDGANDIPMLQTAGVGIAYRPKPAVQKVIQNQILYTDLTSILYAVGLEHPI
jgi:phosphoserine phosphatase